MRPVIYFALRILFFIGAILILTNIFGLFTSLRNDAIFNESNNGFKEDITLTEEVDVFN